MDVSNSVVALNVMGRHAWSAVRLAVRCRRQEMLNFCHSECAKQKTISKKHFKKMTHFGFQEEIQKKKKILNLLSPVWRQLSCRDDNYFSNLINSVTHHLLVLFFFRRTSLSAWFRMSASRESSVRCSKTRSPPRWLCLLWLS